MVSLRERISLRDFISQNYEGLGNVVEIGAFCGSSAIAIMQGLRLSKHNTKLHVFDAFLFPTNDLEGVYRQMLPHCGGASFRSEFDFQTRKWENEMVVVEGDAAQHKWTGGSIEFMHIDCSISREFHEAIAAEFYPHLCQNAIVAHQDYEYERAPFIKEIMESFAPWFKPLMLIGTTKYFRCEKIPTESEIMAAVAPVEAAA